MPLAFDRRHVFQFVVFLRPRTWTDEEVQSLVVGLNDPKPDEAYGLMLRRANTARITLPPQLMSLQPVEFTSGTATWRATWTPERLDLHFDALVVASNRGEVPSLTRVAEIVAESFNRVASSIDEYFIAASRFAVVATIEATRADSSDVLSELTGLPIDNFADFHVRRSRREATPFGESFLAPTNRLETFAANSVPSTVDERSLSVQHDVNTADTTVQYTLDEFGTFLRYHVPALTESIEALSAKLSS